MPLILKKLLGGAGFRNSDLDKDATGRFSPFQFNIHINILGFFLERRRRNDDEERKGDLIKNEERSY
ncbi:unnamed protein product [Amaranthus hypochondriacus]